MASVQEDILLTIQLGFMAEPFVSAAMAFKKRARCKYRIAAVGGLNPLNQRVRLIR